ncbi:MAG: hypothetical protein F4209_02895 [Chloroflexi bacterium]|nr:hypothetical protein [Chloroflexota bacterium]
MPHQVPRVLQGVDVGAGCRAASSCRHFVKRTVRQQTQQFELSPLRTRATQGRCDGACVFLIDGEDDAVAVADGERAPGKP